jgi:hypothetical protein
MHDEQIAIAVYPSHDVAEAAIMKLHRGGFDMQRLSIVGRGYHLEEHVAGFVSVADRAKFFGTWGAAWGGLAGLLFGASLLVVPVLGHVIVLGPLAAALAGGVEGAVLGGGIGALAATLVSLGVPKNSVLRYEREVAADRFLVVAHGTAAEIARAREILGADAPPFEVHDTERTLEVSSAGPRPAHVTAAAASPGSSTAGTSS